jgi:DnaJ-domain-containing protein 1
LIVHLRSLDELEIYLRKERTTGVVRLTFADSQRFGPALAEATKVSDTFPALQVLLVKCLDEDEAEERLAKTIADHGVQDRLLVLPVWWLVWRGRVVMVYKASEKLVREVLSIFSRKKDDATALDPILEWIEKNMHAERGTGKFKNPDAVPPKAPPRNPASEAPTPPRGTKRPPSQERTPPSGIMADPYAVLGVPKNATLDQVRKAYRELSARYHPDKVAFLGEKEQAHAHKRMSEINAAWEAIKAKAK